MFVQIGLRQPRRLSLRLEGRRTAEDDGHALLCQLPYAHDTVRGRPEQVQDRTVLQGGHRCL